MSSRKQHVPKQGAHHGVVELFLDVFPLGISADRQIATVFCRFVDAWTHLPDLYMRAGLEALDDGLAWLRTEPVRKFRRTVAVHESKNLVIAPHQ